MKRYGSVLKVKSDSVEAYKAYHVAVWPEVLDMIRRCNIRNYSIFLKDDLLFGYYEYHGSDHAADMAKMAADPKTREWWAVMMPMQKPLETRAEGEWWANMEEVFHIDWGYPVSETLKSTRELTSYFPAITTSKCRSLRTSEAAGEETSPPK